MVTLVIAWAGLLITYNPTPLAVPRALAVRAALKDIGVARVLAPLHWNRVEATPMDTRYEILGFYRGERILATVTVGFDGHIVVLNTSNLARDKYQYGSIITNDPRLLAMLAIVFVLMSGVWPLWRLRNLDVLAATSLTLTVVLYNHGLLTAMSLVSYPVVAYIAFRCAWWGLGSSRGSPPSTPLYDALTRRWTARQRVRILRLIAVAAALVVAGTGIGSNGVIDVGYAVMEGATAILHGALPYGHIPDVLHGDTYPIGSYLLYVPFAALSPVHNVWDDGDLTLLVAVAAAVLAAGGLWWIARRPGAVAGARSPGAEPTAGLRAAVAWLTFPPLIVTVSTGTSDVALAAMLVGALVLWRRPGWGTAALSAAVWFKAVPAALVPLALARLRGRALLVAGAGLTAVSASFLAVLVALGGVGAPSRMLSAMTFQFTRGSQHTLWDLTGSVPVQQLAEAGTLALVVGAFVRICRDPALAGDRVRFAAIAAAVLLGLQLSASYWNYMYLVWAVPFVVISLLGDRAAPAPELQTANG